MNLDDLLIDTFGRVREGVARVVDGLDGEQLGYQPNTESNSIAWLIWHLTRVQDDHVADVAGVEQQWITGQWVDLFGFPFEETATGYDQSADEAALVQVNSPALLIEYHNAVHEASCEFLGGLTADDLERIVDTRWDPPVTLGVRLVSVIDDSLEHVGQAAYVRGLLEHLPA
jgi:uncharacterized damage-inducible protein DinB